MVEKFDSWSESKNLSEDLKYLRREVLWWKKTDKKESSESKIEYKILNQCAGIGDSVALWLHNQWFKNMYGLGSKNSKDIYEKHFENILEEIKENKPKFFVIWPIWYNDRLGLSKEKRVDTVDFIQKIATDLENNGITPVVVKLHSLSNLSKYKNKFNTWISEINEEIDKLKYNKIDMNKKELEMQDLWTDWLHLSPTWYKKMNSYFDQELSRITESK